MESVWWVFKQLYEKGLVYKGFKVMPFSTGKCEKVWDSVDYGPIHPSHTKVTLKDMQIIIHDVRGARGVLCVCCL